jgi:hypothetical protein
MKLTMDRKGKFQCNWLTTHRKCGAGADTKPIYEYRCIVETADILDSNGFIYDQLEIDTYFKNRYKRKQKALSCEYLAINAVMNVKRLIQSHLEKSGAGKSAIHRIAVTISLEDGPAQMTAEWTPEILIRPYNFDDSNTWQADGWKWSL